MDNRLALYERISLAGGSTLFPGMQARLQRDLRALYRDKVVEVSLAAARPPCNGSVAFT